MPTYDPVPELQKFGYTEREAAFLYLVGMHSGYFLRRQFLAFVQRDDGAMAQRFLAKSTQLGHLVAIEYAAGRHIYHLKSRIVYRVLAKENSQLRREKADREIKSRLMQLDYVLDHFGTQFLDSDQSKTELVQQSVRGQSDRLTETRPHKNRTQSYFGPFPISVRQHPVTKSSLISLAFVDDGLRSISAFVRWLKRVEPVMAELGHAEVVYVSDNRRNFDQSEHEFRKVFPQHADRQISIRGHLLEHDYPIWSMKYRRSVI